MQRAPPKRMKMIKTYKTINEAEGYFECQLETEERIQIPFYALDSHIAVIEPRLSRVLNKHKDWDEWLAFIEWMDLDMTTYIESYLEQLRIDNGGTLKGLTEEWNEQFGVWLSTDSD